jgi:hypothetical protein
MKKYQKIKVGLCFNPLCPIPVFSDKPSKLPYKKYKRLAIHPNAWRASQRVSPQAMTWPTRIGL